MGLAQAESDVRGLLRSRVAFDAIEEWIGASPWLGRPGARRSVALRMVAPASQVAAKHRERAIDLARRRPPEPARARSPGRRWARDSASSSCAGRPPSAASPPHAFPESSAELGGSAILTTDHVPSGSWRGRHWCVSRSGCSSARRAQAIAGIGLVHWPLSRSGSASSGSSGPSAGRETRCRPAGRSGAGGGACTAAAAPGIGTEAVAGLLAGAAPDERGPLRRRHAP